jgi:teichuronic acid exporter
MHRHKFVNRINPKIAQLKSVTLNGYFIRVKQSGFLRSVSTLAVGTVLSQLILFGSSPFLTRIYGPADFGVLALFTSISTLAAILTTGRYELAIGLPDKDEDAVNIVLLTTLTAAIVSLLYFIIILVLRKINYSFLNASQLLHQPVVFLVPVYTFLAANYSSFLYWNQRSKAYTNISTSNVVQAAVATTINIVCGFIGIKLFGLIYGLLLGQVGANLFLLSRFIKKGLFVNVSLENIKSIAVKYIDFPKYMIFSGLLLTTSQQIVPIIFSFLFNSIVVGYFSLANRMLRIPNIVLTTSIGNVFRNDAIDSIKNNGNCKNLYLSTLKKLTILSLPIYLVLWIVSPLLFTVFFGKDWVSSGYFARIICIMLVLDFIASPLSTLFYVIGKQKGYMRLQLFTTVAGILALWIGAKYFNNAYTSIILFTLSNCLFSMITIFLTYQYSKDNYKI